MIYKYIISLIFVVFASPIALAGERLSAHHGGADGKSRSSHKRAHRLKLNKAHAEKTKRSCRKSMGKSSGGELSRQPEQHRIFDTLAREWPWLSIGERSFASRYPGQLAKIHRLWRAELEYLQNLNEALFKPSLGKEELLEILEYNYRHRKSLASQLLAIEHGNKDQNIPYKLTSFVNNSRVRIGIFTNKELKMWRVKIAAETYIDLVKEVQLRDFEAISPESRNDLLLELWANFSYQKSSLGDLMTTLMLNDAVAFDIGVDKLLQLNETAKVFKNTADAIESEHRLATVSVVEFNGRTLTLVKTTYLNHVLTIRQAEVIAENLEASQSFLRGFTKKPIQLKVISPSGFSKKARRLFNDSNIIPVGP